MATERTIDHNHVYRDILLKNYKVSRLNNDNDLHIGEHGYDLKTGKLKKYRELLHSKDGIHLIYGCSKDNCSGNMYIEFRPQTKTWYLTPWFERKDIYHIRQLLLRIASVLFYYKRYKLVFEAGVAPVNEDIEDIKGNEKDQEQLQ